MLELGSWGHSVLQTPALVLCAALWLLVAVQCFVLSLLFWVLSVNNELLNKKDRRTLLTVKSRALTGEKPCINKAIHALLMHGYATFNMLVPGP